MDWLRDHPILGFILLILLFPITAPVLLLYLILQAILRKGGAKQRKHVAKPWWEINPDSPAAIRAKERASAPVTSGH